MNYSFNLIEQRWIPCLWQNGDFEELSLRGLFLHAPELREIAGETPLVNAAIMPVLLAILQRVFSPIDPRNWEKLWRAKAFPINEIEAYFQQWYERFDLFHPEAPFFQAKDERVEAKSILYLAEAIANTHTLFDHRTENEDYALTPAEAARTLLQANYFRLGGGLSGKQTRNFVDSIFARGVLFFAKRNNLFESLVLNLLPEDIMPSNSEDKPVWERSASKKRLFGKNQSTAFPDGYLDYLTWQTNHVLLIPEVINGNLLVRRVTFAPIMPLDMNVRSPQKLYRAKEDPQKGKTWSFMYFNEEKAIWRDYHNLVTLNDGITKPPSVVEWFSQLIGHVLYDNAVLELTAIGMLADQAKPLFYRQERMPLPLSLLAQPDKRLVITEALGDADEVASKLYGALNSLAEQVLLRGAEGQVDSDTRRKLLQQWDVVSGYWERLERHFWEFIRAIGENTSTASETWHEMLQDEAHAALEEAARLSGRGAAALHGQVIAERILNAGIKKVLS